MICLPSVSTAARHNALRVSGYAPVKITIKDATLRVLALQRVNAQNEMDEPLVQFRFLIAFVTINKEEIGNIKFVLSSVDISIMNNIHQNQNFDCFIICCIS